MDRSKKIILVCLIPIALSLLFIFMFTVPAVSHYFDIKKSLKSETEAFEKTKADVEALKRNKALIKQLEDLQAELIGFDVEFPKEFRDEILLIDLELFADRTTNKIINLNAKGEKDIKVVDPEEESKKLSKKRSRRKKTVQETPPVKLVEKSFEFNTVANYNELIDFVSFLESYQRKIHLSGISAKVYTDDVKSLAPRIELKINGSTYKSVIQEVKTEKLKTKS